MIRISSNNWLPASAARKLAPKTHITTYNPKVNLESEPLWYGDSLLEFHVPDEASGGAISVFTATMPAGFGPPRHVHSREDEVMLVLEGEVAFELDGERVVGGPGASVFLPRGVPHAFRVLSPTAAMLGIITPGAFEELFRSLSVPAAARAIPAPGTVPMDIPAIMSIQTRLGAEVVGPPMEG
jgi:quercetin dioxygenase-like cupin family protein